MKNSSRWTLVVLAIVTIVALSGCGSGSCTGGGEVVPISTEQFAGERTIIFGYTGAPHGWFHTTVSDNGQFSATLADGLDGWWAGEITGSINPGGVIAFRTDVKPDPNKPGTAIQQATHRVEIAVPLLPVNEPPDGTHTRKPEYRGEGSILLLDENGEILKQELIQVTFWSRLPL